MRTLEEIKNKIYNQFHSKLNPLENTPKYDLVKIISDVEAGIYFSLLGDIEFLKKQIFPDTAEKEYLRAHWADIVPPLYPETASGTLIVKGVAGVSLPAGCIFSSPQGKTYSNYKSYIIGIDGTVEIEVQAENMGSDSNLKSGSKLTLSSNLIANIESEATVGKNIAGGTDGESDEQYLARVMNYYKNVENGKAGDFISWALASSSEVSRAWEFKNFNRFGALLITVLGGNASIGFMEVSNIKHIQNYIEKVAPPVIFTVKSAEIIEINISVDLLPEEDTISNRNKIKETFNLYFEERACPDMHIAAQTFRDLIVDATSLTDATITIEGGDKYITQLQFPVLGVITWL